MSVRASAPGPRGRLVEIGPARRLHAVFAGPPDATPLVILEAGAFGFSADWAAVQARLAGAGLRSLAYDRAGLGFSDPGPAPRNSAAIQADLETLLGALGETGPFIYCGHSMAGLHARLFAARNPAALTGLVLVDATMPESTRSALNARLVAAFAVLCRAAAAGAALGLLRPLGGLGNAIGLEGEPAAEKRWAFGDPAHNRGAALEVAVWLESAGQALGVGAFDPDLPLSVVLASRGRRRRVGPLSCEVAAGRRKAVIVKVKGANHASLLGPRHARAILDGVARILERPLAEEVVSLSPVFSEAWPAG